MKILLVEDEQAIREVEKAYLEREGYDVVEVENGAEAMEVFFRDHFGLVVLDLNLPGINGIEVCRKIREASTLPIIMVTARVEEIDELLGLEIGADDYIKKPFSPAVLVARVNTLVRRIGNGEIRAGDLVINPEHMTVVRNEIHIPLTTTQFNILYLLARERGKVFTREMLLDRAYDSDFVKDIFDRTIDAHIKAIRKALGDNPLQPRYIETVIGKGYKFVEKMA